MQFKNVQFKFTSGVEGGRGWKGDIKKPLSSMTLLKYWPPLEPPTLILLLFPPPIDDGWFSIGWKRHKRFLNQKRL
jgi:hypothetical protein